MDYKASKPTIINGIPVTEEDTVVFSVEQILSYTEHALKQAMVRMAAEAASIYKRAIELGMKDSQEFINWQDSLNEVSYLHEEDL